MRIIIDFENPGDFSYLVYKFENYNGYSGPVYVVAAPVGSGLALLGLNGREIDISNSIKLDLQQRVFSGFTKKEIEDSVRSELERMEQQKKDAVHIANNSQYGSIAVDPYKDQAQAQAKKFEDMSNGLDILDRAAKSQVKNWGDSSGFIHYHNPDLDDIAPQKESAIPTKLFTVSKPKQTKTIRKVIPMKSNLKFKR